MELENGDYLEFNYKDTIRQLIPNYEVIWGSFIGHYGNGRMIPLKELTSEEKETRENFAEYFYTCMESIVCINHIAEGCTTLDITKPAEYLDLLNLFISFQAHAGRIKDNAKKSLILYFEKNKVDNLISRLDDVYEQRNQVLHNKKLPIRIEDSLVLIATPMGKENSLEKWNSKMNWSKFQESNFNFLSDYLKTTKDEICKIYNDLIGNMIEPILAIVKEKEINLDELEKTPTISNDVIGTQGPQPPQSTNK